MSRGRWISCLSLLSLFVFPVSWGEPTRLWADTDHASAAETSVLLSGHLLPALEHATPTPLGDGPAARGLDPEQHQDPRDDPLTLTLVLERDDPAGFAAYLAEVYDATSSRYGRFLDQQAITARSVFNASGDTGSTCLNGSPNTVAVPAGSPNATAVGGSSLTNGPGRTYGTETWWDGSSDVPPTGQGGFGVSRFFSRPSYQDSFTSAVMRSVPDVVANADPAKGVILCRGSAGGCPDGLFLDNGAAVFTITSDTVDEVTFTATDIDDGVVLVPATVPFAVPPAANGGIGAAPTGVLNNGVNATTITVTLQDALGRPTPGKLVSLSQGGGKSVISGPGPAVTDTNGQIQFTATNLFAQTVTYQATDVTDGNLPIPGEAIVTFGGQADLSCVDGDAPTGAPGYVVTPFATGFFTQNLFFGNVNWGCVGASNPTFTTDGPVYDVNFPTGDLFVFGPDGGTVASGDALSNLGPTLGQPVLAKDGRLYATHGATTGGFSSGDIVEIDPDTGAQLRVVAANLTCPNGLAVDPLSGDLFFDNVCFGAGSNDPRLFRIRDPSGATPTLETYATLPGSPNGAISFSPDGTIYVVSNYLNPNAPVLRVAGTDQPAPDVAEVPGVTSAFWVTVGAANLDGSAKSLIVLDADGSLQRMG